MASAKKCDICGKFYKEYNVRNNCKNVNGFSYLNIDMNGCYYTSNVTDCCPECMDSIKSCIKGLTNDTSEDKEESV